MCAIAETGGTDYVPVVSCLVQLALDPHCRTLRGFENLVEREWVALGHHFVERCALAATRDAEMVICLTVCAQVDMLKLENPFPDMFSHFWEFGNELRYPGIPGTRE